MPFLSQIVGHPPEKTAIIDSEGKHSYGSLIASSRLLAGSIKKILPENEDESPRIAFLAGRQATSVVALISIWLADAIAVPLDPLMSLPEWQWRLEELGVNYLLYDSPQRAEAHYIAQCTQVHLLRIDQEHTDKAPLRLNSSEQNALILFASRNEPRPIPVVHTFSSLAAQMTTLIHAWGWQPDDRLLHVLPLSNHHGLVNGLLGAMAAGSCCEMLPGFKINRVWDRLSSGEITIFTAVPTIYQYLTDAWSKASEEQRSLWQHGTGSLRQALVGPCPVSANTSHQWQEITKIPLHFRYGKTECGMILHNEQCCKDICGKPMPGVNLRITDDKGIEVIDGPGELEVRSPQLFSDYYGHPALTHKSYNHGWYRTGELAIRSGDQYHILGHRDLDVIDTGGYRVSAPEIEAIIHTHPGISECAILGTPCERWGQAISLFVVPSSTPVPLSELREWLNPQLPSYKLPTRLTVLDQMPKTRIGSVDKQLLKKQVSMSSVPR